MPNYDWANGGSVDVFFAWGMILLLWEDPAIPWSGYGIQRQNYVALLQGSKMSAGFYSRNLILDISFRLITSNVRYRSIG